MIGLKTRLASDLFHFRIKNFCMQRRMDWKILIPGKVLVKLDTLNANLDSERKDKTVVLLKSTCTNNVTKNRCT